MSLNALLFKSLFQMASSLGHTSQKLALTFNYNAQSALSGEKLEGQHTVRHVSENLKGLPLNPKQITEQRQTFLEQSTVKHKLDCCPLLNLAVYTSHEIHTGIS